MGIYFGFWFLLSFGFGFHLAQDSVESICRICGDTVNEYCCRYSNRCCEFINPNGCPPEASPETRLACQRLIRCTNSSHCSFTQRCCRTALCGPTCSNVTFAGYKY